MLTDKSLASFLDELASSSPTPGGGSAAGLSAAMGAALISMVVNLTIGRKKYADVQQDMERILAQSEQLRARCVQLMQDDITAFSHVAEAYKMPRESDAEQQARQREIQEALQGATLVPMDLAATCAEILALCPETIQKGNARVVSDCGVAVLLAEAGLRSAALNVLINLASIEDAAFVRAQQARLDELLAGKPELAEQLLKDVQARL